MWDGPEGALSGNEMTSTTYMINEEPESGAAPHPEEDYLREFGLEDDGSSLSEVVLDDRRYAAHLQAASSQAARSITGSQLAPEAPPGLGRLSGSSVVNPIGPDDSYVLHYEGNLNGFIQYENGDIRCHDCDILLPNMTQFRRHVKGDMHVGPTCCGYKIDSQSRQNQEWAKIKLIKREGAAAYEPTYGRKRDDDIKEYLASWSTQSIENFLLSRRERDAHLQSIADGSAAHLSYHNEVKRAYENFSEEDIDAMRLAEREHREGYYPSSSSSSQNLPEQTFTYQHSTGSRTKLLDRNSMLVDLGSLINVVGANTAREFKDTARKAGYETNIEKRSHRLNVNGVGKGSAPCDLQGTFPIAVQYKEQPTQLDHYKGNIAEGSGANLPAIMGSRSMQDKDAVLLLRQGSEVMAFPGPGGYKIEWSPGTKLLPMKPAPSGHLVIPCDNFSTLPNPARVQEQMSFHTDHTKDPNVEWVS